MYLYSKLISLLEGFGYKHVQSYWMHIGGRICLDHLIDLDVMGKLLSSGWG